MVNTQFQFNKLSLGCIQLMNEYFNLSNANKEMQMRHMFKDIQIEIEATDVEYFYSGILLFSWHIICLLMLRRSHFHLVSRIAS